MPTTRRILLSVLALFALLLSPSVYADPQVWQVGTNNPTGSGTGEFSPQDNIRNAGPGSATLLDDDFYTAGTYAAGFNGLTSQLIVAADEPSLNWEHSLTGGDPTNRLHFVLTSAQVTPSSWLRLSVEFATMGFSTNGTSLGSGDHDMAIRFRNSAGTATTLFSRRISAPTNLVIEVPMSNVVSSVGGNTIEFVRTGPLTNGTSFWISFDYVRLEADAGGNLPPSTTPVATQTINELTPLALNISSSDADTPTAELVHTLLSGPSGLTVSPTGAVAWTPTEAQGPGNYSVSVRVSDDGIPVRSVTNQFTVNVSEVNLPPTTTAVPNQTIDEGVTFTRQLVSSDPDLPPNPLSHTVLIGPPGLTVTPGGLIEWVTDEADGPQTHTVAILVSDNVVPPLTRTNQFTITVRELLTRPTLPTVPTQTIDELVPFSINLPVVDPDLPTNTLTFARISGPSGLTISTAGVLSWTPGESVGPLTTNVVYRVTDNGSTPLSATNEFTINVREVNTAPVFNLPTSLTVDPISPLNYNLIANDSDLPANTLTFGLESGPAGLTVSPSGLAVWSPPVVASPVTNTVRVRVSDNGVPQLSVTNQFQLVTVPAAARFLWEIGTNNVPPNNPVAELGDANNDDDIPPGVVTRLPGDPQYNSITNPLADDDYYFRGVYPPGFNGLVGSLVVPNDEPWTAFEKSHTLGDRTNRIHFRLASNQVTPGSTMRVDVEFAQGGWSVSGVSQGTFGDHDIVIRFRNGSGVETVLFSSRLTAPTDIPLVINMTNVQATAGANTLEVVRTGPSAANTSYYLNYDYVRFQSFSGANQAPVIGGISSTNIPEGVAWSYALPISDPNVPANAVTASLVSGPAGLSVSPAGVVTWTPGESQGPQSYTVIVRATDDGVPNLSATNQFTVNVQEVNLAPVPTTITSRTIAEGSLLTVPLTATDADLPTNILTFTLTDGPAGVDVSPGGTLTWTPDEASGPGTVSISFAVTDNGTPPLSRTNSFNVTVNEVNRPPVLPVPANAEVNEGATYTLQLAATDPDIPANALTYAKVSGPAGSTVSSSGLVSWPTTEAIGPSTATLVVRVTDNGSPALSTTNEFIIAVRETNSAPVLPTVPTQIVDPLSPLSLIIPVNDADVPANALTFALVSGPSGATVSASGVASWAPNPTTQIPSTNIITYSVTDNGTPPLSATNQFQVITRSATLRYLWQIGTESTPGSGTEFSPQNNINDLPPGRVTRISGDPDFISTNNPTADDDFYFSGIYRAGFNDLQALIVVPNDEPVTAWENSHTVGDRTNRLHFRLGPAQVVGSSQLRFTFKFHSMGFSIGGVTQGLGTHDVVVNFRNGQGILTPLYSGTISGPTNISVLFAATGVQASLGENSIELIRTGPAVSGTSYWLTYDFVRLEADASGNTPPIPTAVADTQIDELVPYSRTLTATDADVPAQTFTFERIAGPTNLNIAPGGALTWTPAEAQGPQVHQVVYRVTDSGSPPLSSTNFFNLTVREINSAPVAVAAGTQTIAELVPWTFNLSSTDSDIPTNSLSYVKLSGPAALTVSPGGQVTWTPTEADGPGSYQVSVRVTDNGNPALSATNDFTVSVQEINTAPTIGSLSQQNAVELSPFSVTLSSADADLPANTRTFSLVSGPSGLAVSPSGVVTWVPAEDQGPLTTNVVVRVTDNGSPSLSGTNSFVIFVSETNAPPTLPSIADVFVDELSTTNLTISASDPDFPTNSLTYTLVSGPSGLTVSAAGILNWTPSENQGPSTNDVRVRVADNGTPPLSATNQFRVIVREVNAAPASPALGVVSVDEQTPLSLTVNATDSDLPTNSVTFALISGPSGFNITQSGVAGWTPSETDGPSTNEVQVRISDNGTPPLSATNTFSVVVREINRAPIFNPVADLTASQLNPLLFPLTATDPDLPANGLVFGLISGPFGLTVDPDGTVQWSPAPAYNGSTNPVLVRVTDDGTPPLSATNQFLVIVTNPNTRVLWQIGTQDNPEVLPYSPDSEFGMPNDAIDTAPGSVSLPTGGGPGPDDDFYFKGTYFSGYFGNESDREVAEDEPFSAWERRLTTADPINRFHFILNSGQIGLSAHLILSVGLPLGGSETGGTPNPGFSEHNVVMRFRSGLGVTTVLYSNLVTFGTNIVLDFPVSDVAATLGGNAIEFERTGPDDLVSSNWLAFDYVKLESQFDANTPPAIGTIPDVAADELTPLSFNVTAIDSDTPTPQLLFTVVDGPAGLQISGNGLVTWTPSELQGPSTNLVLIRVTDDGVPPLSATNSFTVLVEEVNAAPTFSAAGTQTINEGEQLSLNAGATDSDFPSNTLSFELIDGPPGLVVSPTGLIQWQTDESNGPLTTSVTVRVTDDGSPPLSATNVYSVIVREVNQAPVFIGIPNQSINELTLLSLNLSASDPDVPANSLTFAAVSAPAGLTVTSSGALNWTPTELQGPQTYTVRVRVTDTGVPAISVTNEFTVAVLEVNLPPTITPVANQTVASGSSLALTLSANDPDNSGNALTFGLVSGPAGMTVSTSGAVAWTPGTAQIPSTNVVQVRVTDSGSPALSATNQFTVTVTGTAPRFVWAIGTNNIPSVSGSQEFSPQNNINDPRPGSPTLLDDDFYMAGSYPAGFNGLLSALTVGSDEPWINWEHSLTLGDRTNRVHFIMNSTQITPSSVFRLSYEFSNGGASVGGVSQGFGDHDIVVLFKNASGTSTQLFSGRVSSLTTNVIVLPMSSIAASAGANTIEFIRTGPSVAGTSYFITFDYVLIEVDAGGNLAPVFPTIAPIQVDEQTAVAADLSASDTDTPKNQLVHTLLAGPSGSTLSGTGQFTWATTESHGGQTFPVTVKVTDNGIPPMSATNQYSIVVREVNRPPSIAGILQLVVDALTPLDIDLNASDTDIPANNLYFDKVTGPEGLVVSPTGTVTWTPFEDQVPSTNVVVVRVTDDGTPSLNATTQFTVIAQVSVDRSAWLIGTDDSPLNFPYSPSGEFTQPNFINDAPPGAVTRLPGDPQYVQATNPGRDDDFYFSGIYPAGFNGLTSQRLVPNDEPFTAWEHSLSTGDRTNRFHFRLSEEQVSASGRLQLRFEFPTGSYTSNSTTYNLFGTHDIQVRFRNGLGQATTILTTNLSDPKQVTLSIPVTNVQATLGANTIEFVRTGPNPAGFTYNILFDYVHLTADAGALQDVDRDGLPSGWESDNYLSDSDPTDAASDDDHDGLTALQEYNGGVNSSDPRRPDTDMDGLTDFQERGLGTNPNLVDTDGDGLTDAEEVNGVPPTSPLLVDSDNDGFRDSVERRLGTNPSDSNSKPTRFRGGIGINFVSNGDLGGRLGTNVIAGPIPQTLWNETLPIPTGNRANGSTADIVSPVAGQIVRSDGTNLPNLRINWTSDSSSGNHNGGTGDAVLMNGFIRASTTVAATVTVSNVPFAQYDVYVVVGGISDGYQGRLRLGTDTSTDRRFQVLSTAPQSTFVEIAPGSAQNWPGNLVRYSNLTSPVFSLNLTGVVGYAIGIHAIQIVDSTLDSDGSGIPDWWELKNQLQPGSPAMAAADTDGDGLSNLQEFQRGSDPRIPDTDGDGIADSQESQANALKWDSDGDGISDQEELTAIFPTNPNSGDSDADGVGDSTEWRYHSDPSYRESTSSTFYGWVPVYRSASTQWEWNLENVQLVWDHTVGALAPDANHENELVNFAVRNGNGADFRTLQMALRYHRGQVTHSFSSEWPGGFSTPGGAGRSLRDEPTGGVIDDIAPLLGFSGFGHTDVSDRLQFRLVAQRGAANSWTLTFRIRNQTKNRDVVSRTYLNCTAAASVDAGTATWMSGSNVSNRAEIDLYPGISLYFSPTPLETRPQFAATRDTDDDGIPDATETATGGDPNLAADALKDVDNDGLNARDEYLLGTNPRNPDSDGDGVRDGVERYNGSDPSQAGSVPQYIGFAWPTGEDLNGDGLPDAWQAYYHAYGLSPSADTDSDGQSNSQEALWGTNPFDPASKISLSVTLQTPDVLLQWPNQPGKLQTLQWKTGSADWVAYTSPPLTDNGISSVLLENRINLFTNELYRVDTQDQDSDGDGVTDWAERVVGTDPFLANSSRTPVRILTPTGAVVGSISGDYVNFVEQLRPAPIMGAQKMSRVHAARFLQQATFGPTLKEIDRLQQMGFAAWIDDQIQNPPPTLHSTYIRQITKDYFGPQMDMTYSSSAFDNSLRGNNISTSFARAAVAGPDQLRQRVAFALSQILVTSRRDGNLVFKPLAMANYYDIFVRNAFGSYYDILREVTFHPVMGQYLSAIGNQKAIPSINQYPDENYAREVQQLFTIGLWELNQDGTHVLDTFGNSISTYGTREITEFARVFTGLWFGRQPWGIGGFNDEDNTIPMEMWADKHDFGPKNLLRGFVIPARTPNVRNAERDIEDALRSLMEHPNTAPFIGSQLIQFLVTANPSPAYVARISAVFTNDGTGRRGNLGAVVKAILLDPEARDAQWLAGAPGYGRLKEPVQRAMALARVGNLGRHPNLLWWTFDEFYAAALQEPTLAPTVFNFFRPNYQPPGLMAKAGLVGPVFQITDSYSSISFPNKLWEITEKGFIQATYQFLPDYGELLAVANDAEALVDQVNVLFCGGVMSSSTRQILLESLRQVPSYDRMMRTKLAVFIAVSCPEGAVQR